MNVNTQIALSALSSTLQLLMHTTGGKNPIVKILVLLVEALELEGKPQAKKFTAWWLFVVDLLTDAIPGGFDDRLLDMVPAGKVGQLLADKVNLTDEE